MIWYCADWRHGKHRPVYHPRGQRAELHGGPLDGREADVTDASEALWVAEIQGDRVRLFIVRASVDTPRIPRTARLLGSYRQDVATRTLRWRSE